MPSRSSPKISRGQENTGAKRTRARSSSRVPLKPLDTNVLRQPKSGRIHFLKPKKGLIGPLEQKDQFRSHRPFPIRSPKRGPSAKQRKVRDPSPEQEDRSGRHLPPKFNFESAIPAENFEAPSALMGKMQIASGAEAEDSATVDTQPGTRESVSAREGVVEFPLSLDLRGVVSRRKVIDELESPSGIGVDTKVHVFLAVDEEVGESPTKMAVAQGEVVWEHLTREGETFYTVQIEGQKDPIVVSQSEVLFSIREDRGSDPVSSKAEESSLRESLPDSSDDPHAAKASEIFRSLDQIVQDSSDLHGLGEKLDELKTVHELKEIEIRDVGTPFPKIFFRINPGFEYKIPPGQKIQMRMLGTGAKATSGNIPKSDRERFRTRVAWHPGSLTIPGGKATTVGKSMHAFPLSQDHQQGSETSDFKKAHQDLMGRLPTKPDPSDRGKENVFIRGHLLNAHIGGPAHPTNLFPITAKANEQHFYYAEQWIKNPLGTQGFVYEYKVEVTNVKVDDDNGTNYVDCDFEFEFARLDLRLKAIRDTHHTGVVKSRYRRVLDPVFKAGSQKRRDQFLKDFKGGKVGQPQSQKSDDPAILKVGTRLVPGKEDPPPPTASAGAFGADMDFPLKGEKTNFAQFVVPSPSSSQAGSSAGVAALPGSYPVKIKRIRLGPTERVSIRRSPEQTVVAHVLKVADGWKKTDAEAWVKALRAAMPARPTWSSLLRLASPASLDQNAAQDLIEMLQRGGVSMAGRP